MERKLALFDTLEYLGPTEDLSVMGSLPSRASSRIDRPAPLACLIWQGLPFVCRGFVATSGEEMKHIIDKPRSSLILLLLIQSRLPLPSLYPCICSFLRFINDFVLFIHVYCPFTPSPQVQFSRGGREQWGVTAGSRVINPTGWL